MAANQIKAVRNWHEQLVDFELLHPAATLADLAAFFNKTVPWISVVKNSAAYKEYRAGRIGDHQTLVSCSTVEKLEALADITVEEMLTKVGEEREDLSLADLAACASLALKSLGYGNGPKVQHNTQINNYGTPPRSVMDNARESYKRVHDANTKALEAPQTS